MKKLGIFFLFFMCSNSLWSTDQQKSSTDNSKKLFRTPSFLARLKLKMLSKDRSISEDTPEQNEPEVGTSEAWRKFTIRTTRTSTTLTPEIAKMLKKQKKRFEQQKKSKSPFLGRKK